MRSRLACFFARRPGGSSRRFHSGTRAAPVNAIPESGKLKIGFFHEKYCTKRSFHGTRLALARDYYDVLGVSKNSSALHIKKAYYGSKLPHVYLILQHVCQCISSIWCYCAGLTITINIINTLAKKLHPDTNKDDADAGRRFQEVQCAYETLKHKDKRSLYDKVSSDAYEQAQQGVGGGGGGDPFPGGSCPFDDLFNKSGGDDFFAERFIKDFGVQVIEIDFDFSSKEAIHGCTKTVSFQTTVPCGACGGTGVPPVTRPETCITCEGSGMVYVQYGLFGLFRKKAPCSSCGGTGKSSKRKQRHCRSCKGKKVVNVKKSAVLEVKPVRSDGKVWWLVVLKGKSGYNYYHKVCL